MPWTETFNSQHVTVTVTVYRIHFSVADVGRVLNMNIDVNNLDAADVNSFYIGYNLVPFMTMNAIGKIVDSQNPFVAWAAGLQAELDKRKIENQKRYEEQRARRRISEIVSSILKT